MSVNDIIMAAAGASGAGGPVSWSGNSDVNGSDSQGIAVNFRGEVYTTNYYGFGPVPSIMKLNSSGALQWQKYVGNSSMRSVTTDGSGYAYIFGQATSKPWFGKFDSSGTLIFQKYLDWTYSGNGYFQYAFYDVNTNRIYAVGMGSSATYSQNGLVVCLDTSGTIIWQKLLVPPAVVAIPGLTLKHVTVDPSGNVIVLGRGTNPGSGEVAPIVAKYDSSGNLIWNAYVANPGGSYTADGNSVYSDSSGNLYINGNISRGIYNNNITPFVCKLNSSSAMQWSRWVYPSGSGGYANCQSSMAFDSIRGILYFPLIATGNKFLTIHQIDTSGTAVGAQGLQANVGAAPSVSLNNLTMANYSGQSIIYGAGQVTIATSQSAMLDFQGLNATVPSGGGLAPASTVGTVYTANLTSSTGTYTSVNHTGTIVTATETITTPTYGWTVYL